VESSVYCEHYQQAVELIGGRWTGVILRALLGGVHTFNALTTAIPGLSDRMLSERLRELEREGIVERRVFAEIPVRIEYHLTEKGRGLSDVVDSVISWLGKWGAEEPAPLLTEQ